MCRFLSVVALVILPAPLVASKTGMKWSRLVSVCLLTLLGSGCLYIPTTERYSKWGPQGFTQEKIDSLKPGTTTKADVLRLFGETFATPVLGRDPRHIDKERIYIYQWETYKGFMIVLFVGMGPVKVRHYLCLDFSPDTTLRRVKHIHPLFFDVNDELEDLMREWLLEKP